MTDDEDQCGCVRFIKDTTMGPARHVIILRVFGWDVWANEACTTCGGSGCARKARIDPADKPAPTFDLAPLRNLATAIIMPMLIENARDEWIDYHPRGTLTWDRGQDDAEYGYEHAISLRYGVAGTPWTRDDSVFTAGADVIGGAARAAWEDFAQWLAREHARPTPSDAAEVEAQAAGCD